MRGKSKNGEEEEEEEKYAKTEIYHADNIKVMPKAIASIKMISQARTPHHNFIEREREREKKERLS